MPAGRPVGSLSWPEARPVVFVGDPWVSFVTLREGEKPQMSSAPGPLVGAADTGSWVQQGALSGCRAGARRAWGAGAWLGRHRGLRVRQGSLLA